MSTTGDRDERVTDDTDRATRPTERIETAAAPPPARPAAAEAARRPRRTTVLAIVAAAVGALLALGLAFGGGFALGTFTSRIGGPGIADIDGSGPGGPRMDRPGDRGAPPTERRESDGSEEDGTDGGAG